MAVGPRRSKGPAPSLVRRLARENREMGQRLAQLEYRGMQVELASPRLFDLDIDFPGDVRPRPPVLPSIAGDPSALRLMPLNVPLGRIAWAAEPDTLPVVGIYCPDIDLDLIRKSLAALFKVHHTRTFARLVFCCATLRPIPFLGRYGFAAEHVDDAMPLEIAKRQARRYGLEQLRDLQSGSILWQIGSSD